MVAIVKCSQVETAAIAECSVVPKCFYDAVCGSANVMMPWYLKMQEFFDRAEPGVPTSAVMSRRPQQCACACNQSPVVTITTTQQHIRKLCTVLEHQGR